MNLSTRRTFLGQAAAVPLVFGLAEGFVQDSKDAEPKWWSSALARMKETGRWGLGIVLPPEKEQFAWGQGLWALTAFPDEDIDAKEIFCETVVMILTPEFVRKRFALKGAVDRILLSPEGALLASGETDLTVIKDSQRFAESFRGFIHGRQNERLIERAKAIESTHGEDVKRAGERLGSENAEERTAAVALLARKAETLTPYLAWLEHEAKADRPRRLARNLLSSYFASLQKDATGSKLPYGCTGPHHYDPCRTCGMARISERHRQFLRFLVPGAPVPKKEDE